MSEPLRQNDGRPQIDGYAPKLQPRVIELIRYQLQKRQPSRTDAISGEEPYVMALPELKVIGWENKDGEGEPYSDLFSHVFGEFDIDARFDSIPAKVQSSGCYLGIFRNAKAVPKLWEAEVWDNGFFLAVEVESFAFIPDGLAFQVFPASEYAVFITRGVPHLAFQDTWNQIHTKWLPQSGYRFNESSVFFINYTEKSGPDDERFEAHLCVPVVKVEEEN